MGNSVGVKAVGVCYHNGIGVGKEGHKAFVYYQKSADMRNAKNSDLHDNFLGPEGGKA